MPTQFETDSINRVVGALERIADALETIMDRMPEPPVDEGLAELDACDFPCPRRFDDVCNHPDTMDCSICRR